MRVLSVLNKLLPHGVGDAARQLGLFVLADLFYETVRGIASSRADLAFANAQAVVGFERKLGLFFESGLQTLVLGERTLIEVANWAYVNSHFVVTTGFLVWLYLARNRAFYFVRNTFMVAMALALVGYMLVPTAPPRLISELGIIDTITQMSQLNHDSSIVKAFINPYAAIPSMHMAFALMIAVPAVMLVRNLALRILWALYPGGVLFVVIVTGNHFWLDAVAGALVAVTAAATAHFALSRVRPDDWAWQQAPQEVVA